jgi:hypothetical protein
MRQTLTLAFAVLLMAALTSGDAFARGRGHGGFHGAHVRSGVVVGGAFFFPPAYYYPAPYYYYPPATYYPPAPPVYLEQGRPPASTQFWYYCPSAAAYYPYVRSCPEGWQQVPARPPG